MTCLCSPCDPQDGTLRLWDARQRSCECVAVLDAAAGPPRPAATATSPRPRGAALAAGKTVAAPAPAAAGLAAAAAADGGPGASGRVDVLRCLRNPPVTALAFDDAGAWLYAGHGRGPNSGGGGGAAAVAGSAAGSKAAVGSSGGGGDQGSLSMWSPGMRTCVRRLPCSFVPQVRGVAGRGRRAVLPARERALCSQSAASAAPASACQQPLSGPRNACVSPTCLASGRPWR
jgi:hypothetical protein